MAISQEILQKYNHLLALDDDDDQEKRWLSTQDPHAQGLRTSHFHILSYLLAHPDATAKEISQEFSILRGTLSKRMSLLIKRELVCAHTDANDGRSKHYSLRPAGVKVARLHEELLRQKNAQLTKVLQTFDKDDLATIAQFLTQVADAEEHMHYQ